MLIQFGANSQNLGYIGCFSNPKDPDTLLPALDLEYDPDRIPRYVAPLWKSSPQAMTVDLCIKQCVARGYQYAGLQGGLNCFCLTHDQVLYSFWCMLSMCWEHCISIEQLLILCSRWATKVSAFIRCCNNSYSRSILIKIIYVLSYCRFTTHWLPQRIMNVKQNVWAIAASFAAGTIIFLYFIQTLVWPIYVSPEFGEFNKWNFKDVVGHSFLIIIGQCSYKCYRLAILWIQLDKIHILLLVRCMATSSLSEWDLAKVDYHI